MIPKLSDNATTMLEIGDDGQLKEGETSARGAKRESSSASISTPATQDSNKNGNGQQETTFEYQPGGEGAASKSNAAQVSSLCLQMLLGVPVHCFYSWPLHTYVALQLLDNFGNNIQEL